MIRKSHFTASLLAALLALSAAVTLQAADSITSQSTEDYRKEIEKFRRERNEGLKREDGWLTLVGLYWLKPGENRLGSDPGNVVILPEGKAPAVAGLMVREGDKVRLTVEPGVALTADGKEIKPGQPVDLQIDASGKPTVLELGSLNFYLIKRGDRVGVRIKDKQSPLRASFKELDTYPIRPEWRIVARFEPYKDKKIPIANIVGIVEDNPSPGAVVFEWQGKTYRIDALEGSPEGGLFLLFGDKTNGRETYGAGRFLDTDPPKDGKVVVDFNTAYNPPCAFTAFATCPLPPAQNKLAIAIEAGEKNFKDGPAHH
jgi:uncharacterized protein (DUF1684 family)